ncbi:zinc finger protein 292b [Chanos chanos]|uniref:Zinc finger protein 292b n=1 Tax=Chanos chanos TaxID=29144 RepID=A0A6J2V888_CHACN|nr:zinc finger protein 292-like [Chanos chanos]
MADEEAEQDYCDSSGGTAALKALGERLQTLAAALKDSDESPAQSSAQYCQAFCQTLVEYANLWRTEEDPLPLVEVYMVALLSYAQASSSLSPQCEHVSLVLERLSLSYVELLLSLPEHVPSALWEKFRLSVKTAHTLLQENGISQLHMLCALAQEQGPWTNSSLQSILSNEILEVERVHEFLALEGPVLLDMRVKHLIKENRAEKAVLLAKVCSEFPAFEGKGCFKQMHLLCLCTVGAQEPLMEELSKVDCRDGLEMICNLEADGDEKGAFTLCSAFLTRQLLQEDTYCAWELTLFWSKLLRRLEPSEQRYLDKCKQMSCLSKTAFHILFFIKVIQSEMENIGLPTCIEMCVRALQMDSCDGNKKATICKTISCLLPTDLEVKRACQLTEFLLEPTVDSYYAVETLYNEPDGKPEEESLPVPNSLRCELLLVLKTQWPFDPEFWDWKTLKRHCLALMGEEASIVSSIDELNDGENPEEPVEEDSVAANDEFKDVSECFWDTTNELNEIADEKQKKRQIKKLREKGFVSARFRNWQAYMQYCVLCDKEFLGHRIVRHAQTHFKDGLYSCPICAETFDTKETLEPHVASHVKLSCKERLAAMKTSRKLAKTASSSKTAASVAADLKSKTGVSQVRKPKLKDSFNGDTLQLYSGDTAVDSQTEFPRIKRESTEENVCPVLKCRKGFKYFRNLLAHVKDHGDNEEAKRFLEMQSKKVVCQYCRRHFVSVSHLNDHLQVHCGTKPYICIQLNCKASFLSNAELLVHKKEHPVFKAKCMFPNCGKIFHEAYKLYDHEAQHYKTYTCKVPGCGKVFHSQGQLDLHMEGHVTKDDDSQTTENKSLQPVEETAYLTNHEIQRDEEQNCLMDVTMLNSLPEVEMSGHPLGPVKVKHSVESMLNNTVPDCTTQEYQTNTVKSELELSDPEPPNVQHSTCTDRSVLQPAVSLHMSHQSQPRTEESLIEALLSNHVPPSSVTSTSSFRSVIEDFLPTPSSDVLQSQIQTTVPQSQMQPVYSDGNPEFRQCIPNPGGPKSAPSQGLFLNTMPPTGQASYDTMPLMVGNLPAASQKAPVQVMPQPPNGHCENRLMQPSLTNIPTQSEGAKERHKCAFETCTRDYSSYRSVTKHMKAAHPEFYVQWKLAKKNNKVPKGITKCMSICGNLNSVAPSQNQLGKTNPTPVVQIQKAIGPPPPYPTPCQNSNNPPVSSHSAVLTNQTYSGQMEDMLNPILFSQMGSTPDQSIAMQSHTGPDSTWGSSPGNHNSVLHQQTCHAQPMTPNTNTLSAKPFHSYTHISTPDQTADAKLREMGQLTLPPQETFTTHLMMTQATNEYLPAHNTIFKVQMYS